MHIFLLLTVTLQIQKLGLEINDSGLTRRDVTSHVQW